MFCSHTFTIKHFLNLFKYEYVLFYIMTTTPSDTTDLPKKRGRRKKVVGNNDDEPKKETKKSKAQEIKLQTLQNSLNHSLQKKNGKNIILNLKCSLKEVDAYLQTKIFHSDHFIYKPNIPQEIEPLQAETENTFDFFRNEDCDNNNSNTNTNNIDNVETVDKYKPNTNQVHNINKTEKIRYEEIKNKVKELKLSFYKNENTKKSACFWCTYEFDNDTCHIIELSTKGEYVGHGSFCSPERSVAYLFNNMNWDDSAKMEAYQLINYYYGISNKYEEHIKPAPSPFYFLEKYYGNMSIHEYRKMCKSNYMLLCVDKPMTRVLPEIHEDNEKIVFNNTPSTQTRGNYKVKRQSEKGATPNRNSILRDNFGVAA